ncbi:hypothetical protein [Streptomyces palmae]|nr:hypothetical protein [Streptomyces palmae]
MVRPYALSPAERHREPQAQRRRRRTLWVAVRGVDIGPRLIHGAKVAA